MFDLSTLIIITTTYLAFVFFIGFAAEQQWIPKTVTSHPLTYTLSLGGYVGTWAIFGAIEIAQSEGYTFLAYYFGTSALFIFSPLLLQPLYRLSRTYRLSSLADLFSFRYASQSAGLLVSIGTLIAVLPLMALQISTITESAHFLIRDTSQNNIVIEHAIPIIFCIIIALFSLRFGSTQNDNHIKHDGLIAATAFQSLIKLTLFFCIGAVAMYSIFGSPIALEEWLFKHPEKLTALNHSLTTNNTRTLMLMFLAAALAFPHMYHLAITENHNEKSLRYASWAFPLYLLLLSLPILPILWASQAAASSNNAFFFTLGMGELVSKPSFSLLAYICGLAAASSSTIVIVISVSSMCLNHFVLPYYSPHKKHRLHVWLRNTKILLMLAFIITAYFSYQAINHFNAFNVFSFAAYTAAFQFLPGILACFYWPKGNRIGLISGIAIGFFSWAITIILPMITPNALGMMPIFQELFNLNGNSYWVVASIACLGLNMLTFGIISISSQTDEEQRNAAELCSPDNISKPSLQHLTLSTVDDFINALSKVIGQETAQREIDNALLELNIPTTENRPFALRLLRRQIESNLSGLFGPTVARQLVSKHIPYNTNIDNQPIKDIQLIEHRLANFPSDFSGLAAELDSLRRYHRNTIEHLPIGICTLNSDNEILMWNEAMVELTQIDAQTALGSSISSIQSPWQSLFLEFMVSSENQWHNHPLIVNNIPRWFSLHKANSTEAHFNEMQSTFLLEEVTTLVKLEHDLVHNERLASIGRLAAGVAHEIGNPITGIACLAQNLKYDSEQPEIIAAAKDILTQTDRVTRIVQSLINFSHNGANNRITHIETINLFACAEDAIHLLSLDQNKLAQNIQNRVNPNHYIEGDEQRILQVFLNLLKNALDACEDKPLIIIESHLNNGILELSVTDNGSGIPINTQNQIFEPFFTTKNPGEGTGLGLSVVYSIIEEHHGSIEVKSPINSENNNGSQFIIRFSQFNNELTEDDT